MKHLALALVCSLGANLGHAEQARITFAALQAQTAHGDGYPQPMHKTLCSDEQAGMWKAAARSEGIREPEDFIAALRSVWCRDGNDGSRASLLKQRITLPIRYQLDDGISHIARRHQTILELLSWTSAPDGAAFSVHSQGQRVDISVNREGGGDEYSLRLDRGRWKFSRYLFGGAC